MTGCAWILAAGMLLAGDSVLAGGNCLAPTTGLVPITQFTAIAGLQYAGFDGGLYPGALNSRPAPHQAAGSLHAAFIVARNAAGTPDRAGRIGILTIGMSSTRDESGAFVKWSNVDPLRNPAVRIVNGAKGGASADVIADPAHPYWRHVLARVAEAGLTPAQIQAIWMKEAVPNPTATFPQHAQDLQQDCAAIVRILATMFPNARQCFVSSRIYGGYATTPLNPEPYAYESAFAVKWLIEDQISGSPALNHDPQRGPVMAPWLSWGPYLWADGTDARADGLVWTCADFASDGTHPSARGSDKVGRRLVEFFRSDPVTSSWYLRRDPTGVEKPRNVAAWTLDPPRPNPSNDGISIHLALPREATVVATVHSADGRRVRTLADRTFVAGGHSIVWDGRDDSGRATAPGVYFLRVLGAGEVRTAKVTRIR